MSFLCTRHSILLIVISYQSFCCLPLFSSFGCPHGVHHNFLYRTPLVSCAKLLIGNFYAIQDECYLMLVQTSTHLKPGIVGVTCFRQRERHYSHRLTWTVSHLPACLDALYLTRHNKLHSQINVIHKGIPESYVHSSLFSCI